MCSALCRLSLQETCQCLFPGNVRGGSVIPRLSPPCSVCRQLGCHSVQWDLIACCHFDQRHPVILRDAEHLGLWPSGFFFSLFFLSLKDVRQIDLWNWLLEHRLCLVFISAIPASGPFLRAAVINYPTGLLNWRCQSALVDKCSYRKCPQGGSTSSCSTGCTCAQSLRESGLPGLWITVGCAWANTQRLQSPYFFSLKLHSSPPGSCLPWVPLPAEVPRRLHTQEGDFSWGPQHRTAGYLVTFPCILWIQDILYPESGHHFWGSLGSLAPARENQTVQA